MVKEKTYQSEQKKLKKTRATKENITVHDSGLFPIVGIGASAGGLEALEQFLGNVPKNNGMAYVVIQHLDPTQKGMLPELLQRITKLRVCQAKEGMVVKQDCIYVIPPNKSMSIVNGVLHLFEPIEPRGLRLPVDFFLRSLALDRKELSIGLILSGMGSDGSIGLSAIKEQNGIVMVQDPSTAKFDSMPRSAMDSVLVDIVASPSQIYEKLLTFHNLIPLVKSNLDIEIKDKSALEKIITILRTFTGNDFSMYKKSTIYRRIERRMGIHKIDKISSYVHFLHDNQKEVEILFKELLIGVTNFFRDAMVWEKLSKSVIPKAIANLPAGSNLRAWVPACSSGEEAYSLAIVFKEAIDKIKPQRRISLQIFATDLDNDAIELARKGIFPVNIAADVSQERLNRFFNKTEDGYQVKNDIREIVVFAQHNLIMHPPFTKIDILSCRNLLIYMEPDLQKRILGLFYYSLNDDGFMLLGSSETLGVMGNLFVPIESRHKIYKRSPNSLVPDLFNFPSSFSRGKIENEEKQATPIQKKNIQTLADQLLLQHFSPPSVLVNENGDIIYISGRTGKYLEPAAGKANMNIFAMLRQGLNNEFPTAFSQAIRKKETVVLSNLNVGTNGSSQSLNIKIVWIEKPEDLKGMVMVIFIDTHEPATSGKQAKTGIKPITNLREEELKKELQNTREEMQNSVEEMQATQEELKSSNEELQSSNEELQSTNEELTSSKEEMQSLNEELQTVNAELLAKVEDFSRVDNDMKNLLNSTDIATMFLDKELKIRRYTNQATKLFKLIKSDIGRLFTDQVSDLIYPEMADDAIEVLKTLVFIEKHIPGKDGRWFSVRIMPYRTFDDRIDGLVITFINISKLKQVEEKLSETEQAHRLLMDSLPNVVIKLSTDLTVQEFNAEAEKFFGIKTVDVVNQNYIHLFAPGPVQKKTEKLMLKLLQEKHDKKTKMQVKTTGDNFQVVDWSVKILSNNLKETTGMIMMTEVNEQGSKNKK